MKSAKGKTERKRFQLDGLTQREAEVFSHLADGLDPQTVARELGIRVKTVYTLCSNMMPKVGVKNLHELEILAVQLGRPPRKVV
jgi:DNA-binding CsgD family transcriptional regulator